MILRKILIAKIQNAKVTSKNLHYIGSISIGKKIMFRAGIIPWEEVLVANISNGERFITYAIPSDKTGEICLNGAAARKGEIGDKLIIFAFAYVSKEDMLKTHPRVIVLNEKNEIIKEIRLNISQEFLKQF